MTPVANKALPLHKTFSLIQEQHRICNGGNKNVGAYRYTLCKTIYSPSKNNTGTTAVSLSGSIHMFVLFTIKGVPRKSADIRRLANICHFTVVK